MGVHRWFRPKIVIPLHEASMSNLPAEAGVRTATGRDRPMHFMKPGQRKRD